MQKKCEKRNCLNAPFDEEEQMRKIILRNILIE